MTGIVTRVGWDDIFNKLNYEVLSDDGVKADGYREGDLKTWDNPNRKHPGKFTKRDAYGLTCMMMIFFIVVWIFLFFSGTISKPVAITLEILTLEILTFGTYMWTGVKAIKG